MPRDVGWEWNTTGWWVKPRNAREVTTMIGSIDVYSTGQQFAWRGMTSADYPLVRAHTNMSAVSRKFAPPS